MSSRRPRPRCPRRRRRTSSRPREGPVSGAGGGVGRGPYVWGSIKLDSARGGNTLTIFKPREWDRLCVWKYYFTSERHATVLAIKPYGNRYETSHTRVCFVAVRVREVARFLRSEFQVPVQFSPTAACPVPCTMYHVCTLSCSVFSKAPSFVLNPSEFYKYARRGPQRRERAHYSHAG